MMAFPEFRGATRRLILINLGAYFALLLASFIFAAHEQNEALLKFDPFVFVHGALWQPLTYSFIHPSKMIIGTLFELLSLWFLAGFLENYHNAGWVTSLYAASVLGTAAAALALYAAARFVAPSLLNDAQPLYGCFGGIFGLLTAIGVLYGDMQFMMFPLPIGIKARYLVVIYVLVAVAMLFGQQHMYAFAQLGGAAAGALFVRRAPRRNVSLAVSESWYGLRNRYYRWKRRRAARKFEVYMRSQGRPTRIDDLGHPFDNDRDPDDKKRWN